MARLVRLAGAWAYTPLDSAASCRRLLEQLDDLGRALRERPGGPDQEADPALMILKELTRVAWRKHRRAEARPNDPHRVQAGRRRRPQRTRLTPKGRQRLREAARRNRPWLFSARPTGAVQAPSTR